MIFELYHKNLVIRKEYTIAGFIFLKKKEKKTERKMKNDMQKNFKRRYVLKFQEKKCINVLRIRMEKRVFRAQVY